MLHLHLHVASILWLAFLYTSLGASHTDTIEETLDVIDGLTVFYDPPDGFFSSTFLGVFVRAFDKDGNSLPDARIYYEVEIDGITAIIEPDFSSQYATYDTPVIELATPFKGLRERPLWMVAVIMDENSGAFIGRSEVYKLQYIVEGTDREWSYAFLVPGVDSGGYFMRMRIEQPSNARASVSSSQEFADYNSKEGMGGMGPYDQQLVPLYLPTVDPTLIGFEGGFAVNTTNGKHFGVIVPYHNGNNFHGKVVRIDLQAMEDPAECLANFRTESYDADMSLVVTGPGTAAEACVFVLDLATMSDRAVGFRRGMMGHPYGYLSPGQFNVLARLDMEDFGLHSTKLIDLGELDVTMGGYQGGFVDGSWACFNPFRSFAGPKGGIRSNEECDANHLYSYYSAIVLCVDTPAWEVGVNLVSNTALWWTIDLSKVDETLRGFGDVVRLGRHAYFAPYASFENQFASKVVRLDLGDIAVGTTLQELEDEGLSLRQIVKTLDLAVLDDRLKGFSGVFTMGKSIYFVPFRNAYEPAIGQRGHGLVVRLDVNDFSLSGLEYIDAGTTTRTFQVPSFADVKLRGFVGGAASGYYALLFPFFNGEFSGKIVRFKGTNDMFNDNPQLATYMDTDLQQVDLKYSKIHEAFPEYSDIPFGTFKGYRGGFVSLWQGKYDDEERRRRLRRKKI